jgi:DnaJ-domain-containing protein 1
MMILPLIKTKAGLTLFQIFRIWNLLQILKASGRFNFNGANNSSNSSNMSKSEAYKILNLNPNKKYSKTEIVNAYKKIMKKVHPDISPELTRLASIVNEAKEVLTKDA